jgi:hypothetical protein
MNNKLKLQIFECGDTEVILTDEPCIKVIKRTPISHNTIGSLGNYKQHSQKISFATKKEMRAFINVLKTSPFIFSEENK